MLSTKVPLSKLREIVGHAYDCCSAYRQLYDTAHVDPREVVTLSVLPIVTPHMLIENPSGFRAEGEKPFRIAASSGTFGSPKLMFRTSQDFEISVRAQMRLMKISGIHSDDVVAIIQPFDMWGYGNISLEATRRLGGLAVPVGQASKETAYLFLKACNVTAVDVAPSRFLELTALAGECAPSKRPPIRVVMLAGEPVSPENIKFLSDFWNAQIFNHYGSEETDGLGGTCASNDGFHVFDDLFVFEIVDDLGNYVQPGEAGRLIVTSLYHRGTPLIRYHLGDLVRAHTRQQCSCGLEWPRLDVLGKSEDMLWLRDSVKLYAYQIDSAIKAVLPDCLNFQAVCTAVDSEDLVTVTVHTPSDITHTDIARKLLDTLCRCSIDVEALVKLGWLQFELRFTDYPLTTTDRGKTRRMIDRRNLPPE